MRGDIVDSWSCRSVATSKARDACVTLFKNTPEDMALKIEAYIATGLAGASFSPISSDRMEVLKS